MMQLWGPCVLGVLCARVIYGLSLTEPSFLCPIWQVVTWLALLVGVSPCRNTIAQPRHNDFLNLKVIVDIHRRIAKAAQSVLVCPLPRSPLC